MRISIANDLIHSAILALWMRKVLLLYHLHEIFYTLQIRSLALRGLEPWRGITCVSFSPIIINVRNKNSSFTNNRTAVRKTVALSLVHSVTQVSNCEMNYS